MFPSVAYRQRGFVIAEELAQRGRCAAGQFPHRWVVDGVTAGRVGIERDQRLDQERWRAGMSQARPTVPTMTAEPA